MVSIDLGVISDPRPEPVPSRPRPPRTRRAIGAGLCLLLAAALLGASARSARPDLPEARVELSPSDAYFVDGGRLYVVGPDSQGYDRVPRTITAYTLPGGERLWQRPLEIDGPLNGMVAVGDKLLLHVSGGGTGQAMVALDRETAEPRWRAEAGWAVSTTADRVVFSAEGDGTGDPLTWRAVRTGTGQELWRREFPPQSYTLYSYGWGTRLLMVVLPGDRVELWDLDAGRRLAATRVPADAAVSVTTESVLAVVPRDGSADVTAYALPDLRPLWQRTVPGGFGQAGCGGRVLCVATEAQDRTVGIDPATGERLWESPAYGWYSEIGSMLLAEGQVRSEGGGVFIGNGPLVALDSRTGREIRDFGPWRRLSFGRPEAARRTVAVYFDSSTGTALVAEVDLDAMSLRVLGRIHQVDPDCLAEGDAMICRRRDGSLGIWDLPVGS